MLDTGYVCILWGGMYTLGWVWEEDTVLHEQERMGGSQKWKWGDQLGDQEHRLKKGW